MKLSAQSRLNKLKIDVIKKLKYKFNFTSKTSKNETQCTLYSIFPGFKKITV